MFNDCQFLSVFKVLPSVYFQTVDSDSHHLHHHEIRQPAPAPAGAKCRKNLAFKMQLMYLVLLCPDPLDELIYNMDRICITEKVIKMLHGRFVHVDKTLTDLQILGCELHQNTFGGRASPGPAGEI